MRLGLKAGDGVRARVGVRVGVVVRAGFTCSRCCTAEPGRELGRESPHLSTLRDGVLGGDWGYPTDGGGPPAAVISFWEGSCGGTARCFGGDASGVPASLACLASASFSGLMRTFAAPAAGPGNAMRSLGMSAVALGVALGDGGVGARPPRPSPKPPSEPRRTRSLEERRDPRWEIEPSRSAISWD